MLEGEDLRNWSEIMEVINVAHQDGDRLQTLVDDLFELARLDANEDGMLGFEEALSTSLLDVARGVVLDLGLDPGPVVVDDAIVRAIEDQYRQDLYDAFEVDRDAPQPEVLSADVTLGEDDVVTFLQQLLITTPVPALGEGGAWRLLVAALLLSPSVLRRWHRARARP